MHSVFNVLDELNFSPYEYWHRGQWVCVTRRLKRGVVKVRTESGQTYTTKRRELKRTDGDQDEPRHRH